MAPGTIRSSLVSGVPWSFTFGTMIGGSIGGAGSGVGRRTPKEPASAQRRSRRRRRRGVGVGVGVGVDVGGNEGGTDGGVDGGDSRAAPMVGSTVAPTAALKEAQRRGRGRAQSSGSPSAWAWGAESARCGSCVGGGALQSMMTYRRRFATAEVAGRRQGPLGRARLGRCRRDNCLGGDGTQPPSLRSDVREVGWVPDVPR